MLRVLYKVSPESAQKQEGATVDKKVAKGPESGAQKVTPKKPEAAFKAPRAQKAKEASKKEDEARARQILASIDDDVTSSLNELQAIEAQRVAEERSGKPAEVRSAPKKAEIHDDASVEKLLADLHKMENDSAQGPTHTPEVALDNSSAESIELDLSDALDNELSSLDQLADRNPEQGRKNAEVADELATLLEADAEKAARAKALSEKARKEGVLLGEDFVALLNADLDEAPAPSAEKTARLDAINKKAGAGEVLSGQDFDDLGLDELLNANLDAAAAPTAEAKVQLSPTMRVEAAAMKQAEAKAAQPGRKTEIFSLDEVALPKISENLPAAEREDQLMSLRRTLQEGTEADYQQLLALEESYDRALPGPARNALEHQVIALRGRIDQRIRNEFCADHDDPAEAQKYYGGLAARKAELLKNPEARRVLEKLDEQRGRGGWAEGEYITQEMIDGLNAGAERDLARAWHRLEHDQGVMASGIEQIRSERQARMNVDRLQLKLIRNGEDLGIPADVIAAFRNPKVNRGDLSRVADQVLVDLGRYDRPQNFKERLWSTGLAIAKVFGKDSFFGRRRANAEVNALQLAKDDHDAAVRMRQAGKNAAVLEHGSGAPGFMIATDFGSSFRRGPAESGVSVAGGRRGEQEPGITAKQMEDMQDVLTSARHMMESLKTAKGVAKEALLERAETLREGLQARMLRYTDTSAARSRVYELASGQLADLEEAISEALPDTGWAAKAGAKKAEASKKSLAEVQKMVDEAKWDFDDEAEDLTNQLEEVTDQVSPSDRFIDSPTINEGRGRTLQGLGPDQRFIDGPTINEGRGRTLQGLGPDDRFIDSPTVNESATLQDDRTLDGQSRFMDTLQDRGMTKPDGTRVQGRAYEAFADTEPGPTASLRGERFEGRTGPELIQRAGRITETLNGLTETLNRYVEQNDPVDGQTLDYASTYIGDARRLVDALRKKNLLRDPKTIALSKAIARAISASRDSAYEAQQKNIGNQTKTTERGDQKLAA